VKSDLLCRLLACQALQKGQSPVDVYLHKYRWTRVEVLILSVAFLSTVTCTGCIQIVTGIEIKLLHKMSNKAKIMEATYKIDKVGDSFFRVSTLHIQTYVCNTL